MNDPYAASLPLELTSFVGREEDVAALVAAVRRERLVTLTGVGGIGKTRTALQVARAVAGNFTDGVVFVDLAVVTEAANAGAQIRRALGAADGAPNDSPAPTAVIGEQQMLLVLDNCEQIVSGVERVAEAILRACPQARILATSREPLGVAGEFLWRLDPLTSPAKDEQPLETLRSLPAVALFVERAARVQPRFALTVETAASVADICRALDGIPLAIELAAARLRTLSIAQLADRLGEQLALLSRGSRGAPERQRTMRAAIAWSHDQLDESLQTLFRRLAVFSGGWTLEAAEGVCAGGIIAATDVLDLLESLVDRSLVTADASGPEARFRFLVPVLEFARAELMASDEGDALGQIHCHWFAGLAARAELEILGPAHVFWMHRLAAEDDNLRGALSWASAHPEELVTGLQLAADLRLYWSSRYRVGEAREWTSRLLSVGRPSPFAARAGALVAAAWFGAQLGDLRTAERQAMEAVELARELADDALLVKALWVQAQVLFLGDRLVEARPLALESLATAEQVGDRRLLSFSLNCLASIDYGLGDVAESPALLARALSLATEAGPTAMQAAILISLGEFARLQDDLAGAADFYTRAAATAAEFEHLSLLTISSVNLGLTLILQGELAKAGGPLRAALEQSVRNGSRMIVLTALTGFTAVEASTGDAERAAVWLRVINDDTAGGLAIQAPDRPVLELARKYISDRLGPAFDPKVPPGMGPFEAGREALALTATQPGRQPAPSAASPTGLSRRELEVLRLLAEGASNRDIADRLVLSTRTVATHLANVYGKLGLRSRVEAVRFALDSGLVTEKTDATRR